jgi:hypothetical protein
VIQGATLGLLQSNDGHALIKGDVIRYTLCEAEGGALIPAVFVQSFAEERLKQTLAQETTRITQEITKQLKIFKTINEATAGFRAGRNIDQPDTTAANPSLG